MKKQIKQFFVILILLLFTPLSIISAKNEKQNLTNEKNISVKSKENYKFKCKVNCCFSIGQNCKAAYHIQRHKKRFQASPLDWMRDYTLDTVIHLFKTKFVDFFEKVKEVEQWPGNYSFRSINDTKNQILSIHHFPKKHSVEYQQKQFRKMMLKRANKVHKILDESDSIALVYCQDKIDVNLPTNENLIDFLKQFSEIYPNKKIYLIVAAINKRKELESKEETIFEENDLKIVKFSFWDFDKNWTGNHKEWDKIMNSIELEKTKSKKEKHS